MGPSHGLNIQKSVRIPGLQPGIYVCKGAGLDRIINNAPCKVSECACIVYTERLIILKSDTNSAMKIFDIDNSFCLIVPLIYSTITYVICLWLLTPKKSDFFKFLFFIRTKVVLYV